VDFSRDWNADFACCSSDGNLRMSALRIYTRFVTFISDQLVREEVATEFTGHHGQVTQESIFRITKEKQKLTK